MKAVDAFSEAILLSPGMPEYRLNRGHLLILLDRSAEAVSDFQALTRLEPDNPNNWEMFGLSLAKAGRWVESATNYAKMGFAAKKILQPSYWYKQSLARLAANDEAGYRADWKHRVSFLVRLEAPNRLTARSIAWSCSLAPNAVSDPAWVVDLAKEALKAMPEYAPSLAALGAAFYRAGRFEEAKEQLELAISRGATYDSDRIVSYRAFLAMVNQRLGRKEDAKASLAKAIGQLGHEKVAPEANAANPFFWTSTERRLLIKEAEAMIDQKSTISIRSTPPG